MQEQSNDVWNNKKGCLYFNGVYEYQIVKASSDEFFVALII